MLKITLRQNVVDIGNTEGMRQHAEGPGDLIGIAGKTSHPPSNHHCFSIFAESTKHRDQIKRCEMVLLARKALNVQAIMLLSCHKIATHNGPIAQG